MTQTQFVIGERVPVPAVDINYVTLPECPLIPRKLHLTRRQLMMWAALAVLLVGMVGWVAKSGMNSGMILFPVSMIAMMFWGQRGQQNQKTMTQPQLWEARREFAAKLDKRRAEVIDSERQQFDREMFLHPEPALRAGWIGGPRQWERRPTDPDFGTIRIGVGPDARLKKISLWDISTTGQGDPADHDPVGLKALSRFEQEHAEVENLPISLPLLSEPVVRLHGDLDVLRKLVWAMITEAALLHSPNNLKIMVITGQPAAWEPLKWLPHACDNELAGVDLGGPGRLIWATPAAMLSRVEVPHGYRKTQPDRRVFPMWLVFCDVDVAGDPSWAELTNSGAGANGATFIQLIDDEGEADE